MKARFLALAALVLGLASCQNDPEIVNPVVDGEVDFQLAVGVPELGTRAADVDDENGNDTQYGYDSAFGAIDYLSDDADPLRTDWTDVDLRYSLEVYDKAENYTADAVPVKDRQVIIVDKYEPVAFNLRLVPGRPYHFVVFADFVPQGSYQSVNEAISAQENLGLHHTIGDNLGQITIQNDGINDECTDAYFATKDITISNSAAQDMTLTRPYGKLRVIATDLAELNLNVDPKAVIVKYNYTHPTDFNAVTGVISGENRDVDQTFDIKYHESVCKLIDENEGKVGLANHVYTEGYDNYNPYGKENENGVKRHTHMTLFTDYILAKDQQEPFKFTMTVIDKNNQPIKETHFNTEIPIQRNFLTTIVGNVLTTATEIKVTIDDNFDGYHNTPVVDTTEALEAAVANAEDGDIILIDGEVTMPYFTGKALTFAGISDKAVVKQSPATHIDAFYAGATLNFKDLTLVGESYQNNTQGYQKAVKETYKNCHFVNYIMFAGDVTTVTDCTFENEGQYFWTGTADNITFTNCEFDSVERAVKVCTVGNAGARTVTFNNCQFSADTQVKSAIEIDGSKGSSYVVNINSCTATGFNVSSVTGESLFNIEGADNVKVYIDGNEWLEKGVVKDENGNYVVNSLTTLETALEVAGAAGAGDTTIVFAENAQLNMTNVEWTPIKVDGYHGADIVTIEGNGAVITGLKAPLFAGGFAGGSGIVIKDLTIKDSAIVSTNTIGSGAFIESVDSMAKIELTNCHLINSTVTGGAGSRTGGLIGWTAGYNNVNDGPVKTYVTIDGCSVVGCIITCDGSVGGINGHAGNNAWTYTTIKNCTVKDNTLASTDDGGWRVGVVVGTANVGELTISNITESGNTLTQTGKTAPVGFMRNLYGRAVLGTTGKLTIDGYKYVAEGQFEAANGSTLVASTEAFEAALANSNVSEINIAAGNYEGTFHVLRDVKIVGADNAKIIGRVHINSANATFENVMFDRNETNSNEANNTASNALQYKAVVMIYGDQTHTIKFDGCKFYNNNGTHKSAITNVACDLIVDNCYFEGYSSSIYSQANLSVTNSTFNYTGGNNVILSINGCGNNGGKVIFKNNTITNHIFALSQFLSTVGFGNGTYHFDIQGNTEGAFDHYFLNVNRVTNKTFADGSITF